MIKTILVISNRISINHLSNVLASPQSVALRFYIVYCKSNKLMYFQLVVRRKPHTNTNRKGNKLTSFKC